MPLSSGTVAPAVLGYREVAALLRVPTRTAQRRLRAWFSDPAGPRVECSPRTGRRGRPAYTIERAELARAVPEIDEG